MRRQGTDYITSQSCFVVPVRVVYGVGFGTNQLYQWFVSVLTTQNLWLEQKSSQMCNNEVRISERGFIFIGACNAPYNRIGNAVNTTLKLPRLFLLSYLNLFSYSTIFFLKVHYWFIKLLSLRLAVCGKIANKRWCWNSTRQIMLVYTRVCVDVQKYMHTISTKVYCLLYKLFAPYRFGFLVIERQCLIEFKLASMAWKHKCMFWTAWMWKFAGAEIRVPAHLKQSLQLSGLNEVEIAQFFFL